MNVETLIYSYLIICVSMILFNVVCGFIFKYRDRELVVKKGRLTSLIEKEIKTGHVDGNHKEYLYKKIQKVNNLVAFENTIKELSKEHEEAVRSYIEQLTDLFEKLMVVYNKKDDVQATYFPYLISRYKLFKGKKNKVVNALLREQLDSSNIYSRENALCAIYSIEDVENIIKALQLIDSSEYYHHRKLISEGLVKNCGKNEELYKEIWKNLNYWSLDTQIAVLDYIRFTTGDMKKEMYELFSDQYNPELNYCAIRYFGRYYYEPAYEKIIDYLESDDDTHWEYKAIAATSALTYPGDRTVEALKKNLKSRSWYVRFNSSKTLKTFGLEYNDLRDVFEGEDHFAGDMMRYRIDQKNVLEGS